MKNVFIVFLTCLSFTVFSQLQNIPLITVTGQAVVKVIPDYAVLGVRIKKDLSLSAEKPAFQIFKDEDTKIRLFDFNEADMARSIIQMDSSSYFKEVFITFTDLKKLDKYLLELVNLGYTDYIYLEYKTSNYAGYKNQARKDAINAAKKKAVALTAELGQTIGKAHTIEEIKSEDYNWYNYKDKKNLKELTFKLGSDNYMIEPGYIVITSLVKVSFDLPAQ